MSFLRRPALLALAIVVVLNPAGRSADKAAVDRAIENAVRYLRAQQRPDGYWQHEHLGATALAGLALLENGVKPDDEAIVRAATVLRRDSVNLTHTYSLSLCILFFDRLGDSEDVPLIESMAKRLIAGQTSQGGWSYNVPGLSNTERERLSATLKGRKDDPAGNKPRDDQPNRETPPQSPRPKPPMADGPFYDAVRVEGQQSPAPQDRGPGRSDAPSSLPRPGAVQTPAGPLDKFAWPPDNSNTQFALMALWVSRKHGAPVERALKGVESRFRLSYNVDGGWNYMGTPDGRPGRGSSAAMTCSGLLGLAVGHANTVKPVLRAGTKKEKAETRPGKPERDLGKDPLVVAGLRFVGAFIDEPRLRDALGGQRSQAPADFYYFLWSLERVAVAYNLDTIANKDWYAWGSTECVNAQDPDGSWSDRNAGVVDTSFALLFLCRANLAKDLSITLSGKVKDPGKATLKAGGGEGSGKTTSPPAEPPERTAEKPPDTAAPRPPGTPRETPAAERPAAERPAAERPAERPVVREPDAGQLGKELTEAAGADRERLLDQLRRGKTSAYTDALAGAIPRLDGDAKRQARDALTERLSQMTSATLGDKLADPDAEIRRAAALACAMKEDKTHVPRLIDLLEDTEVVRAAHASLKSLTGKDFGPAKGASRDEITRAVGAWKAWQKENGGK